MDNEKKMSDEELVKAAGGANIGRYTQVGDRVERPPNAPSIKTVAEQMDTSRVRLKKLLITAGYYSTELSRKVQSLSDQGICIEDICKQIGLSTAGVNALLPYKRGAYNLEDPPRKAENLRILRKRNKACEKLGEHLKKVQSDSNSCDILWDTLDVFQNYLFKREKGDLLRSDIPDPQEDAEGQTVARQKPS